MCPYSRLEGVEFDGKNYKCYQLNALCGNFLRKWKMTKDKKYYGIAKTNCCLREKFDKACPIEMKAFRAVNKADCEKGPDWYDNYDDDARNLPGT